MRCRFHCSIQQLKLIDLFLSLFMLATVQISHVLHKSIGFFSGSSLFEIVLVETAELVWRYRRRIFEICVFFLFLAYIFTSVSYSFVCLQLSILKNFVFAAIGMRAICVSIHTRGWSWDNTESHKNCILMKCTMNSCHTLLPLIETMITAMPSHMSSQIHTKRRRCRWTRHRWCAANERAKTCETGGRCQKD